MYPSKFEDLAFGVIHKWCHGPRGDDPFLKTVYGQILSLRFCWNLQPWAQTLLWGKKALFNRYIESIVDVSRVVAKMTNDWKNWRRGMRDCFEWDKINISGFFSSGNGYVYGPCSEKDNSKALKLHWKQSCHMSFRYEMHCFFSNW